MFLRSSALAVALVTAALVPQHGDDPASAAARIDESGMIFFAVLEGLYRDGVSNEAVDRILLCDPGSGRYLHFVYACPICTPALDALRTYRNRAPFSGKKSFRDTFGPGLPPATIEALASEDIQVRLFAIESLMRSWVSRRLDGMRLTPEERAQWTRDFELGRKMGMSRLPSSASVPGRELVTTCAFCDAATGACHESASPAPPW